MGEVVELGYGKALKADKRNLGSVPVYGSNGHIGWHDQALVEGPGIVVGRKGNPGIVTWVPTSFYPIDTTFYVLPKNTDFSLYYLYFALTRLDLQRLGADSAVPGLNRHSVYGSQIVLPPSRVSSVFDRSCRELFGRVFLNETENRTLATTRDTILPKLLSGEIRVPADEVTVAEDLA